ncbi:hypothetical protein BDV96DRAFT_676009 [Lophiotrema nucula]|uniref:Lysine-specific metallo-endopeptidase domain-containing protein n=1 Tax=Lophiotrema nucula TaxID=690887 RepID=A0A6A5YIN4_9PLEO|nr:hypothetical protein BDV96DRAFT_676009 [Lophiotrema nucula]
MRYLSVITIFLVCAVQTIARTPKHPDDIPKKTYYIDDSCDNKKGFPNGWLWTTKNAKAMLARANSDTKADADYHSILERIFQFKFTDDKKEVEGVLNTILGPIEEITVMKDAKDDMKTADVRIFCDNDKIRNEDDPNDKARWVRDDDGVVIDHTNLMVADEDDLCSNPEIGGWNTDTRITWDGSNQGHNPNRAVISLCDRMFEVPEDVSPSRWPLEVTPEIRARDYTGTPIEFFHPLICRIILHELMHALRQKQNGEHDGTFIDDFPKPKDPEESPWKYVLEQKKSECRINADNYAYASLWAMVAGWKWSIVRLTPPDTCSTDGQKQDYIKWAETKIKEGRMKKYQDVTRRNSAPMKSDERRMEQTEASKRIMDFLLDIESKK